MQKGNIGVTTENIFPIIKKFLYSDHEIFLRELVSNAVDATQKLKTLAAKSDFKGELGDLTVRVKADKENGTITISDRGIGLTAEEIDKYINQIAQEHPILVDKYLMGKEIEVDAVCDGEDILIPGIMEHIERAGIHSGDSISVYPAKTISEKAKETIAE